MIFSRKFGRILLPSAVAQNLLCFVEFAHATLYSNDSKMLILDNLTWNEALSGVFGSISLASWIFLLVPQLIENYKQGNADGISITFILIWAAGDVFNLIGALLAGLVPTVTALAIYFCFADGILILQCLYYNSLKKKVVENDEPTEESPLLNGRDPATKRTSLTDIRPDNLGLPGSRRRSSAASQRRAGITERRESLASIKETSDRAWFKNTLSVIAIVIAGAGGWAIAWSTGAWHPTPVGNDGESSTPVAAEILGYISAVLYLGARIPQIIKNQRERSCEGLSLLFFILSVIGNSTYGAGILFHSIEKDYVLLNLPWLLGSLGTMVEDAVIFAQFSAFGAPEEDEQDGD